VIYEIDHVTTYDYGGRVGSSRCLLHLEPRNDARQTVLASSVEVDPAPVEMIVGHDFFGNAMRIVRLAELHARLVIRARSRVAVAPAGPSAPATAWERVRDEAAVIADLGPDSPVHHIFPSRYAPLLPSATDIARASFPPGRSAAEGARDLAIRIHGGFAYDPDATEVSTPLREVLASRRGVCQDFAHLMISGLRGLGIPAAYVSGYLRTRPPPGRERLVGADATHAWVAVWCGRDGGWIGFDPTNAIAAGEDHVILARGRDYGDVSPVSGVVLASSGQRLSVSVDVRPVEEPSPQALAG
jgi:transglutaminase-like putative cysteine protease